eukprot:ctg_100.g92
MRHRVHIVERQKGGLVVEVEEEPADGHPHHQLGQRQDGRRGAPGGGKHPPLGRQRKREQQHRAHKGQHRVQVHGRHVLTLGLAHAHLAEEVAGGEGEIGAHG